MIQSLIQQIFIEHLFCARYCVEVQQLMELKVTGYKQVNKQEELQSMIRISVFETVFCTKGFEVS